MPKNTNRGPFPHRTVQPRPGELPSDQAAAAAPHPFVPVLYADAKTLAPDHLALRCPTCGFSFVSVLGLGVLQRKDYDEVAREPVDAWKLQVSDQWRTVPGIENVRHDSLLIEIHCDLGHVAVLELGSHKSLTSIRLTRMDTTPIDSD